MKAFLSWPILVQRGEIEFRDLRVRRDGRLQVQRRRKPSDKSRHSRGAVVLGALALSGALTLIAQHHLVSRQPPALVEKASSANPSAKLSGSHDIEAMPVDSQKGLASASKQRKQYCTRLTVGAELNATDARAVRAGDVLNFGGFIASTVPSECRKTQLFLIRETGKQLVIEKLIPQTRTGLRD